MQNDLDLARKIEAAVAASHLAYIKSYNQLFKTDQAQCLSIAGGQAALVGPEDVLSQVIGIGLRGRFSESDLKRLENFYWSKKAKVAIELCPLAEEEVLTLLNKHQYSLVQYSNLFYLDPRQLKADNSQNEIIITQDIDLWAEITIQGFLESDPIPPALLRSFKAFAHIPEVLCFLAFVEGKPAGGGAMGIYKGVCDLGFASSLIPFRGRGIQKKLLAARLEYARQKACPLAISTAEPGSISAQNLEKIGFKLAYTRSKFEKNPP